MSNTSATGGYILPTSTTPLPGSLTLEGFIQTVIVGITGFTGSLVRPKWQIAPPKQPDISTNWIAFAVSAAAPDANAYVGMDDAGNTHLQRQSAVSVQLSFYGPNALDNISLLQDGLQLQQNLEALSLAKMGYVGMTDPIRGPDLVNERWIDRFESTLLLTRQVQRLYPVLSFATAQGTIHTVIDSQEVNTDWTVEEP